MSAATYPHVFRPIRLGPVEIKNRFYFSPHGVPYSVGAVPADTYAYYYGERARGGCGLTIHAVSVMPRRGGLGMTPYLRESIPSFRAMAEHVHEAGAKIFAEIHYSRVGNGWRYDPLSPTAPLFGPSPIGIFDGFHVTHEMSVRTIEKVIEAHRVSSANLREAGYDGIEVHCAHAMLIEAFLSPYFNRRTDEWGGSLENRMRFLIECLRASREGAGPGLAVGMRFNVDEMIPGGLTQSDTREVLERLAGTGLLDFVDMDIALEPNQFPFGMPNYFLKGHVYESFVKSVRSAAGDIPVLSVLGRITSIAGREPRHVPPGGRAVEGGRRRRRPRRHGGRPGRRAQRPRGGPSRAASAPRRPDGPLGTLPDREEFLTTPAWYERQLAKLGVSVRTGTEATPTSVLAERPDAVLVATGSRYLRTGESGFMAHEIPGWDRDFVYVPEQIIEDGARPQGKVIVLDEEGINTACGAAEILARAGASVTLVARWLQPVEHLMSTFEFIFVIARLRSLGVTLLTQTYLEEIGDHAVTLFDVITNEETDVDGVGAVVLATTRRADPSLPKALEGRVAQLFAIGDANGPRGLREAFYEGQRYARFIGEPGAPRDFTEDFFSPIDYDVFPRPAAVLLKEEPKVTVPR